MHKKRLLKLAALLDVVPPDKFDMRFWALGDGTPMGDEPKCSSVACALGWATTIPEFKRAGLKLVAEPGDYRAHIRMGDLLCSEAAAKLFDISYKQACDLFEPRGLDSNASTVAAQIRGLVAAA